MAKAGRAKTAVGNPHFNAQRLPSFSVSEIRGSLSEGGLSLFNVVATKIGEGNAARLLIECTQGEEPNMELFSRRAAETARRMMGRLPKKYSHRARR